MTKPAFTPGPWHVVIDDTGDRPLLVPSVQASEELDCAIVHWDGFWQPFWQSARGEREWNANARLIAAAPELYEALSNLLIGLDLWSDKQFATRCPALMQDAENALAKAQGIEARRAATGTGAVHESPVA